MIMIPKNIENEVKERANNDIVSIIGRYVNLRMKGISYEGLCPFHDDNHLGNFLVTPSKHIYKCFSCGAGGDAVKFIQEIEKVDYKRAIEILGSYVGVYVYDDADGNAQRQNTPYQPKPVGKEPQQTEQRKIGTLPFDMVSRFESEESNLIAFIKTKIDPDKVSQMVGRYHIGEIKGYTIFWQIDKAGKVIDGKLMKYNTDGHRAKDKDRNGEVNWVSYKVKKNVQDKDLTFGKCLFGEHLINQQGNEHKTIAVAESEKTAIIGSMKFPQYVWVSCGGVSNLGDKLLRSLEGRNVIVFPDAGYYDQWANDVSIMTEGKGHKWDKDRGCVDMTKEVELTTKLHFKSVEVNDGLEKAYREGLVKYGDDLADLWLADQQPRQEQEQAKQTDEPQQIEEQEPQAAMQEQTAKVIALPRYKTNCEEHGKWNFDLECFEFNTPNYYGETKCPF